MIVEAPAEQFLVVLHLRHEAEVWICQTGAVVLSENVLFAFASIGVRLDELAELRPGHLFEIVHFIFLSLAELVFYSIADLLRLVQERKHELLDIV